MILIPRPYILEATAEAQKLGTIQRLAIIVLSVRGIIVPTARDPAQTPRAAGRRNNQTAPRQTPKRRLH